METFETVLNVSRNNYDHEQLDNYDKIDYSAYFGKILGDIYPDCNFDEKALNIIIIMHRNDTNRINSKITIANKDHIREQVEKYYPEYML